MQKYYAQIYKGVGDLSDCPQIIKLQKEEEEYEEDQMEASNEVHDEDEDYDDYENYDYDEDDYDDLKVTSTKSSSTTSTTTSYPDPEGNFVIAEPPSHLGGASPASKATSAAFLMASAAFAASLLT